MGLSVASKVLDLVGSLAPLLPLVVVESRESHSLESGHFAMMSLELSASSELSAENSYRFRCIGIPQILESILCAFRLA